MALLVGAMTPSIAGAKTKAVVQKDSDYKVVAYYLGRPVSARRSGPEKIHANKLTHINYAFASIKDGLVTYSSEMPEQLSKADIATLLKLKRHNAKLQVLISIGGWTGSKEFPMLP